MRRMWTSTLAAMAAFVVLALAAQPANAQRDNSQPRSSPNAAVSQTIGTTEIDLHYGRPGVKGRAIFGGLVPYGDVWRAGANEPSTITFASDVMVEGKHLNAGSYNIFFRPAESGNWDVIFATPVRWGTMYDEANKVLEVSVTPETIANHEWLSYTWENLAANGATLVMQWGTKRVPIRFGTM